MERKENVSKEKESKEKERKNNVSMEKESKVWQSESQPIEFF